MDSPEFIRKMQERVAELCKGLDDNLPAYNCLNVLRCWHITAIKPLQIEFWRMLRQ